MWYSDISRSELQELALKGQMKNRLVTWRIMLGILSGPLEEKINQCKSLRSQYQSLKHELEPSTAENLPPEVFNPLSQDTKVLFNQEPLVQAFQEPRREEDNSA
jgi:hypothetical protein